MSCTNRSVLSLAFKCSSTDKILATLANQEKRWCGQAGVQDAGCGPGCDRSADWALVRLPSPRSSGAQLSHAVIERSWYGWSAEAKLHWMMPIVGTGIFGFGCTFFSPSHLAYIT